MSALLGPNGSGKSTTMKCIANLVFPDKNSSIRIAGFDLFKSRNQALSPLSALIESPGLYYNLSGMDNLKLFANLRKISKQRLEEVIEFSGLGHAIKKKASDYSMGMKQRLALAIAILPNPTFLILDEPFNGLDPQGVFDLREVIKGLAKEGCGILFSSHQLLEMEKISSRNVFIKAGEIVSQEHAEAAVLSYRLFLDRKDLDLGLGSTNYPILFLWGILPKPWHRRNLHPSALVRIHAKNHTPLLYPLLFCHDSHRHCLSFASEYRKHLNRFFLHPRPGFPWPHPVPGKQQISHVLATDRSWHQSSAPRHLHFLGLSPPDLA